MSEQARKISHRNPYRASFENPVAKTGNSTGVLWLQ